MDGGQYTGHNRHREALSRTQIALPDAYHATQLTLPHCVGLHQQSHLLQSSVPAMSILICLVPLPSHLPDPLHPLTTSHRPFYSAARPHENHAAPCYHDVSQYSLPEPFSHLLVHHVLSDRQNIADPRGRRHQLPLLQDEDTQSRRSDPNTDVSGRGNHQLFRAQIVDCLCRTAFY